MSPVADVGEYIEIVNCFNETYYFDWHIRDRKETLAPAHSDTLRQFR